MVAERTGKDSRWRDTPGRVRAAFCLCLTPNSLLSFSAHTYVLESSGEDLFSTMYGLFGLFSFMFMLVVLMGLRRTRKLLVAADVASAVLAVAGSLLASPAFDLSFTGCCLISCGAAWLCVRWGENLAKLDTESLFRSVLLGVAVPCAYNTFVFPLAAVFGPVPVTVVLSTVSAAALCLVSSLQAETAEVLYTRNDTAGLRRLVVAVVVYGAVLYMRGHLNYGYDGMASQLPTAPSTISLFLIGFGLYVWLFWLKRSVEFATFVRYLLALFALCVFLAPMPLGGLLSVVLDEIMGGISGFFIALFVLVFAYVARHCRVEAFVVFGAYYALSGMSYPLFALLDGPLSTIDYIGGSRGLFQSFILLTLVGAAVFSVIETAPGTAAVFGDFFDPAARTADDAEITVDRGLDTVSTLAAAHGLTDTETQIMRLISHGRSRRYIAETLFLSENTVKAYTKRVYAKLGVHTKQDLIDVIEQAARLT